MIDIPDDIFSEPANVDPDTVANLGPLRRLAGTWEGRKGVDLNPKAAGPERKEFIERIDFQSIDYQLNGPQLFYGLRYHTHILATDEDATFHDQVGWHREYRCLARAEPGRIGSCRGHLQRPFG